MNFNLLRAAVVLLLAIASQAWAFTSTHPSLYLRGSHNGWGSTPMVLVGDNQWQLDASFSGSSRSFKFDVFANWSENYGDNNNDKIADRSGGNINVPSDGNWRIRYNDKTRAYSLTLADANVLPIANAGPDQTVTAGATVQFNGSQSSDPDGSIASFSWSNGLTGAQPSLRYDLPGSYEVRLTVTDNKGGSSSDVMQLTVQAADNSFTKVWPSVALRGTFNAWGSSPMSLVANNLWQLDANFTGSSRTFKFDLYSNWSENYGDNNSDGIADRSGNNINVPSDGNWRITINDQTRAYTVVKLSGSNQPPLANAGADFSVVKGSPAQFDGSQSSDPDGSIVSYSWSNGLSGVKPTFTYTTEGQYPVTLTVTDDKGATASDVVTVTVTDGQPVYSKLLPSLYLRGTHNGWGSTAMKLVDNNIWQGTASFDGSATARFKFDVYANWSENYGDSNKDFIAERSGGDIYPSQGAGEYRIRFNDKSRIYSLEKVVVNVLLGDINDDDSVDGLDVQGLRDHLAGLTPSPFNLQAADTDCDGAVANDDAELLAAVVAGTVPELSCPLYRGLRNFSPWFEVPMLYNNYVSEHYALFSSFELGGNLAAVFLANMEACYQYQATASAQWTGRVNSYPDIGRDLKEIGIIAGNTCGAGCGNQHRVEVPAHDHSNLSTFGSRERMWIFYYEQQRAGGKVYPWYDYLNYEPANTDWNSAFAHSLAITCSENIGSGPHHYNVGYVNSALPQWISQPEQQQWVDLLADGSGRFLRQDRTTQGINDLFGAMLAELYRQYGVSFFSRLTTELLRANAYPMVASPRDQACNFVKAASVVTSGASTAMLVNQWRLPGDCH